MSVLLGAIVSLPFTALYDALKEAVKQGKSFRPQYVALCSTMQLLEPPITKIVKLDEELGRDQSDAKEIIENIKEIMLKGKELVDNCSKVRKWEFRKKISYAKKLKELNGSLRELLQILQAHGLVVDRQILTVTNTIDNTTSEIAALMKEVHRICTGTTLPTSSTGVSPSIRGKLKKPELAEVFNERDDAAVAGNDDGTWVSSGENCWMMGAKHLVIRHAEPESLPHLPDASECWERKPHPKSRFQEVAQLKSGWYLEIRPAAPIETDILSPKTTYGTYLVYRLLQTKCKNGFHGRPFKLRVIKKGSEVERTVYLDPPEDTPPVSRDESDETWMELELCEIRNEGDCATVELVLQSYNTTIKLLGFIVEGIELRPKPI